MSLAGDRCDIDAEHSLPHPFKDRTRGDREQKSLLSLALAACFRWVIDRESRPVPSPAGTPAARADAWIFPGRWGTSSPQSQELPEPVQVARQWRRLPERRDCSAGVGAD